MVYDAYRIEKRYNFQGGRYQLKETDGGVESPESEKPLPPNEYLRLIIKKLKAKGLYDEGVQYIKAKYDGKKFYNDVKAKQRSGLSRREFEKYRDIVSSTAKELRFNI